MCIGSIDSTIRPSRCLLEMTRFGYDLDTISLNALYMAECVLKALDYLAVKKLRHGDVKGLFTADFCLFTSMKYFIVLKH